MRVNGLLKFNRELDVPAGVETRLSPLVSRVLAPNPGPFTFKGTGVYLVGAGHTVAVIDPGPDMVEHLSALKRVIGARRVSHILVTHSHRDHSPAAAALKIWSGAPVYGLPDHAATLDGPLRPSHRSDDKRSTGPFVTVLHDATGTSPASAGAHGGGRAEEAAVDEAHDHDFVPDVMAHDGMRMAGDGFSFECVATPGHTANHVCYALTEERALFSGDHVMGWSTSVIAPPDGDMGQYIASLEKLLARDETLFYPTHGSPIPDAKTWVTQLIAHRRGREQQILEGLHRGESSVTQLVLRLYPDIAPALRAAAAQQVMAHLLHLAEKGAVARDGALWRRRI
jgi:glyoxylase-like metal-dependent hydrolase (beta-lactamase superfamily II)